ncbi:MAG: hypothetical protein BGO97_10245 [Micrococcales bacterium 70-64]|nr:MAG: hypothetical protein ABT06_10250 [Leifsonia sp. SCN 70-46]OJX86064.1 MAG: hypothetical protein BGO97_10245 [Micrococcales bacterium 70-64]
MGMVLIFHLKPGLLPGGYVGVDIFFVISGFLITGQLVNEVTRTGSVRILQFWGRRARRLLPAAFVVLLASAALTLLIVPAQLWRQFLGQIIASSVYVQNWVLAANSVDYLASVEQPSIVQHFWSLSVEEQFYIVVPVLLGILVVVLRRRLRITRARLGMLFAGIAVVSFAYSVYLTHAQPTIAYFATTTRAWEFAAGGILACVTFSAPRWVRALASWGGLAAMVVSALVFDSDTAFPGFAAVLPVLGAAAVIWAGDVRGALGTGSIAALRPVQYAGDISYSVYLWHWPLIVVFPFAFGTLSWPGVLAIVVVTVVLAALTKRFVEDPLRRPELWGTRIWPSFAMAMAGALVVSTVAGAGIVSLDLKAAAFTQGMAAAKEADPDCWGGASLANKCTVDPTPPLDPAFAQQDRPAVVGENCAEGVLLDTVGDSLECAYGDTDSQTTVVLVGDSHASQWMPALDALGRADGWRLVTLVRSSCPFGGMPYDAKAVSPTGCTQWRELALDRVLELHPERVIVGGLAADGYELLDYSLGTPEQQVAGYGDYLRRIVASGISATVMRDTPYLPVAPPDCLSESEPSECTYSRATVLDDRPDSLLEAARAVEGVQVVDLDDLLCAPTTCASVVGGLIVYSDRHHMTATFATSLEPFVRTALGAIR